jgi:hypothetical protein
MVPRARTIAREMTIQEGGDLPLTTVAIAGGGLNLPRGKGRTTSAPLEIRDVTEASHHSPAVIWNLCNWGGEVPAGFHLNR